jgi:DNA-binding NarL/FixJ family response regulator
MEISAAGEGPVIRVLVVDDQPAFRRQLCRLLTRAGLGVVGGAGTIAEAEGHVEALKPDLALVDLMLPGVHGMEGIARLKALRPELRVIVVSVLQTHADLLRAATRDAGAEDFFPKDELSVRLLKSLGWKGDEGGKLRGE